MNIIFHKESAAGSWYKLSLAEQLGNIGSEVGRAANSKGKNEELFQGSFQRALELFDMTLEDSRWRGRRMEIARARELFCSAALGEIEYQTTLHDLNNYFLQFAFAARKDLV